MKQQLEILFSQAVEKLKHNDVLPAEHVVKLQFERTRQKEHGDFACNVAMTLAKAARRNPRELAELLIAELPAHPAVEKYAIAGPGFINIFLAQGARHAVLQRVFADGDRYGLAAADSGRRIQVEFVSANPTGPLHVGHGRGAAYGDTLARLLSAAGHSVSREYYVNDAGRQMDILATSVWLRYLQLEAPEVELPDNAYQGDYIIDMARDLRQQYQDAYAVDAQQLSSAVQGLEPEAALDALIQFAKTHTGEEGYHKFFARALDATLQDIQADLHEFGVDFDVWFSEKSLFEDGKIQAAIEQLKESGHVYEKEGTWWFRSSEFGDEKDRVVVRENGQPTYFASDIAYHKDKLDRGFDECINIWGADHHGYIPRVKAALQALNLDASKLNVLLVQFAVLWRGGEKVKMSTRSGSFVTLRELREEVGADAARYFYAQRKSEQHMDFDLDLAKSQSNDNPLYYVQYAHARICSIFRQADERQLSYTATEQAAQALDADLLEGDHQQQLMALLELFPERIALAAKNYEPHQITYYLRDLATAFHAWYNSDRFLEAEATQRNAHLLLCAAVRQVLANGLAILGVTPAEQM